MVASKQEAFDKWPQCVTFSEKQEDTNNASLNSQKVWTCLLFSRSHDSRMIFSTNQLTCESVNSGLAFQILSHLSWSNCVCCGHS